MDTSRLLRIMASALLLYTIPVVYGADNVTIRRVSKCALVTPGQHISNDFDWNLCKEVHKSELHNNVLSTISVKLVLAMLYLGAAGNTSKELEKALLVNSNKQQNPFDRFSKILASLQTPHTEYDFDIGTTIFIDQSATLKESYKSDLNKYFKSSIQSVDFKQQAAATATINDWAKNVTRDKIQELVTVDQTNPSTVMLLVNAIYFKGLWEKPFPVGLTKSAPFTLENGKPVDTEFMEVEDKFLYADVPELNCEVLRLPYMGEKFAMYVFLPNSATGLNPLAESLSHTVLHSILSKMQLENVVVKMPKFHFESTVVLAPILTKLGLHDIFSPLANLSNIGVSAEGNLKVSNVIQKAGLLVNEQGSTAYVATQAGLVTRISDGMPRLFKMDHPFAFTILDESECIIAFVGKVLNPAFKGEPVIEIPITSNVSKIPILDQVSQRKPNPPTRFDYPIKPEQPIEGHTVERFDYFDTEFLQKIEELSPGNVVISPESIKSGLSVILEGARGNTETELLNGLRLPNDKSARKILLAFRQEGLKKKSPNVTLVFQSRIFLSHHQKLSDIYQQTVQDQFNLGIQLVDFTRPDTVVTSINQWVNTETKGLIPDLVKRGDVSADTQLLLTNCIYFKGEWLVEFDPTATREDCFYTSRNNCQKAYLMHLKTELNYAYIKTLGAHVVEIPFKDSDYSMLVILPYKRDGLVGVLKDLAHHTLSKIIEEMRMTEVDLTLPRFTIDYTSSLVRPLEQVGIRDIFTSRANLSGILAQNVPIAVSDIIHKAKIEVNEKGAKAAAATGVQVIMLSIGSAPITFKADYPFIFFIQDKKTGGNLFEGTVKTPDIVKSVRVNRTRNNPNRVAQSVPQATRIYTYQEYIKLYQTPPFPLAQDNINYPLINNYSTVAPLTYV